MSSPRSQSVGRLFNYANNPISLLGIALTTVSAILIVVFVASEMFGAIRNPYVGMFAFLALPTIFVVGLVLIPIGMLRRKKRLIAEGLTEAERSHYPRLDFNDPGLRRVALIVGVFTVANGAILGTSSYMAVETMDSVEFCGTTCHTVMQPEHTAYQQSPHSRVACVDCHIGPGASWFVKAKIDGLRQVWHTVRGSYNRPIPSPVHTLRPARETCESCHWPAKHFGDKLRVFARFSTDETSSPSYSVMLMKTGGGNLDTGQHGGIHWWHIYADNKIRYVSGDDRQQQIDWVELTTADGEVRTYTRPGKEPPAAERMAAVRVMDCIDCHNRPTHLFQVPAKSLDSVLERLPSLRDLPYYKREAMAAVTATYPTHAEGVAAVRTAVRAFYEREYADLVASQPELVMRGAEEAAQVYARSVFPEMDTNWQTHPNNIGHDDFPGCWRCHDDELTTADGAHTIPADCETCHAILVDSSSEMPDLAALISAHAG
jgi:nitrate/TMAO reductase-like tetraheme cytochrome c subunit